MLKFTKTSSKQEVEGVWITIDNEQGGELEVLIARSGGANLDYEATMQSKAKPFRKKGKDVTPAQALRILNETLAETVLLDWKPNDLLLDDSGNKALYSQESALELLKQDEDFRKAVMAQADDVNTFLTKKTS